MRHLCVAVVLCVWGLSGAARLRHRINLGTLSSLASSSMAADPPSGNRSSTDSASQPEKPLQAIKIDDGGSDVDSALGGGEQAISIVFDKKLPWKADEQSLVSSALNRRYGIQSTALDAMRCSCTKSNEKESLLGAVDHTVSCDCM